MAHLNINALRNKFLPLKEIIGKNLDIVLISETKLDSSFTTSQFVIDGYHTPFRRDKNEYGGGLMCFINENIICHKLDVEEIPKDIETIFVVLNFRKHKWLLVNAYKPPNQSAEYFTNFIVQALSKLKYNNLIIMGDLNLET